jgi:hypothetical protein
LTVVVKADGLAAGKGVFVCNNMTDAEEAMTEFREQYGNNASFLVEDKLIGDEISIIGLTDGKTIKLLPPSQDHKQVFDNDLGPNTGGMGAFCPVPFYTTSLAEQIEQDIIQPTLKGIEKDEISKRYLKAINEDIEAIEIARLIELCKIENELVFKENFPRVREHIKFIDDIINKKNLEIAKNKSEFPELQTSLNLKLINESKAKPEAESKVKGKDQAKIKLETVEKLKIEKEKAKLVEIEELQQVLIILFIFNLK